MTTATGSAVPPVVTADPENSGVGAVHNAASPPPAPPAPPPNVAASGPGAVAPSEPRPASGAVPSEARRLPFLSGGERRQDSLSDPVLVIVFSLIGIGGAMLGFVVWRMRGD